MCNRRKMGFLSRDGYTQNSFIKEQKNLVRYVTRWYDYNQERTCHNSTDVTFYVSITMAKRLRTNR